MVKTIVAVRRFNPIVNTELEHKFLDAAERLFFKGFMLGSDPEMQIPTLISNHLTSGLLQYIRTTGRYASGMNLFEKLRTRDVEISSLLCRVLILADEEVRAVALLHEAIQQLPMQHALLDVQAAFCKSKGRGDLALECAKRSVTAAPGEFGAWARLAEIYVFLEEWELALLTLNSCPMFTHQDRDAPRMPGPKAKVVLPVLPDVLVDEFDDEAAPGDDTVAPNLRKLIGAGYKGTFLKAYKLLTEIAAKIGWDHLLRIRSQVFVMQEEYRSDKPASEYHGDFNLRSSSATGIREGSNTSVNGATTDAADQPGSEPGSDADDQDKISATSGDDTFGENGGAKTSLDEPDHTVQLQTAKRGNDDVRTAFTTTWLDDRNLTNRQHDSPEARFPQIQDKRLCERWFDNLTMVLYEDLRVYTIWRSEMAQYKSESLQYKKSAEEWEILGELADRLHHPEEALEAYEMCLDVRFSPKAMKAILALHEQQGDVKVLSRAIDHDS
ncbi:MAG: hypothetical protein M1826_007397 [Phylliscum demangeonii]|nr:MAG: hypothetical protein M1826_007397 [Phylliscum demangeonii]